MDTTINPLPTLSARGYIYDLSARCDQMMAYFLASQKSESYLYGDNVASLQNLVQKYGSDPYVFTTNLKAVLIDYFGRQFPAGAQVNVRHDSDSVGNSSSYYNVWIGVEVTEKGQTYSLNEQILKKDSTFQRVINATNYGIFD